MQLDLNQSQLEAVKYCDGPQLVIAGAGSGKTRVLTYKIAYLMDELHYEPWSILALTFTNKAAGEMRQRIATMVDENRAHYLYMGTFHSIFSRILRVEAEHVGYQRNFTIYDESDSRSLLKNITKELGFDEKIYKPSSVHACISMAKNHLISASDYATRVNLRKRDNMNKQSYLYKIYQVYEQRCVQANAMDFDDLLVLTWKLFHEHEDIRQKYAARFRYVLVDEFQDTNAVQQEIVTQLTREQQHICVVGDDAQSIYGFRGANIDNILNFQNIYPQCKLFKLEQNYRSTQNIVQAANSLIRHNERQIPKASFSENALGEKLIYEPLHSDREEATVVGHHIADIVRQEHCDYTQFAILYRTNAQSRILEEELLKQEIPYRIFGGMSFYQRKVIKDVLAYFRMVANPDDEEALRRIINYPKRGIGDTTVSKIAVCAQTHQTSLWNVILNPLAYNLDVSGSVATKLHNFATLITSFMAQVAEKDAYELGTIIIKESGISTDIFSSKDQEALDRQENLKELLNGLQDFVASQKEEGNADEIYLVDFLQEVSLLTDQDRNNPDDNNRVSLMTIHSAKGLEFANVFIVGLEENIFPSPMCTTTARELEEERRLLYVAITRAEKRCFITNAKSRWRYGKLVFSSPSRFIRDIDARYMALRENGSLFNETKTADFDRPVTRVSPSPLQSHSRLQALHTPSTTISAGGNSNIVARDGLKSGSIIEHQRFGIGTVDFLEGEGDNLKATVTFENVGRKVLLLKFARYKIKS